MRVKYRTVGFDEWAKDLSIKVALLNEKMNALFTFLEIEVEVTDEKITLSTKVGEDER